jgi:LPS-assembly protein
VSWKADRQTWEANTATLYGVTEFTYRDYVISADKVTYNRDTTELDAEGHLEVRGGPDDVVLTASRGTMRLNMRTARFYDVTGTMGVRGSGRSVVYSTANPFIVSARVLIQAGERNYRVIDGTMTNCRLPNPDWQLVAKSINIKDGQASTRNTFFKFLGVPLFYLPYLKHPVDETGRQSGFLVPVLSVGSSIRGFTIGEQYYLVLNRSMDMVIGTEYYSRRGWAPNGDFRYKGPGLDHLNLRWNALFDRGYYQTQPNGLIVHVNQGGTDISAFLRKDFSPNMRIAGNAEYLSNFTYRLVFNDSYWQAIDSQVKSDLAWTYDHRGYVSSVEAARLQTFATATEGNQQQPPPPNVQFDEVRLLHLPNVRFDVLDRPLASATSPLYWGMGSSIADMARSEPDFHAHNVGRIDLYPHLSVPLSAGGWSVVPEVALRGSWYSTSQVPDLVGARGGVPAVSHDPIHRLYGEAALDLRPPALVRDFAIGHDGKTLRHVIEPELTYHFVGGIGDKERDVLTVDTTDIATDTNELGFSLTQRFYVRPRSCNTTAGESDLAECDSRPREWASWQIAQKYFLDPNFGGALIPGRRNVFSTTLDLTGVAFLTEPRNLSPLISRMRFEAIHNLRVEWDMDYDPKPGRFGADNVFAGYSWGITTIGVGHALLNAPNEQGSKASLIQSQQLDPFIQIGRQNRVGFNLAMNGGYDFVNGALQYGGVQAVYNWDCCGLTFGYRRFALGALRDETQYLYSFTLANFGSVGDIRRSNAVFRDPSAPPAY